MADGKAHFSLHDVGGPCTFKQVGNQLTLTVEGEDTLFTVNNDGSLTGPPDSLMTRMKKKKEYPLIAMKMTLALLWLLVLNLCSLSVLAQDMTYFSEMPTADRVVQDMQAGGAQRDCGASIRGTICSQDTDSLAGRPDAHPESRGGSATG